MSDELERLRADLEVLLKYWGKDAHLGSGAAISDLKREIAKLESEADPWAEAKKTLLNCREYGRPGIHADFDSIDPYIRHLEAENAKQAGRILTLENDLNGETLAGKIIRDDLKARIAELVARPAELADRARILVTAFKLIMEDETIADRERLAGYLLQLTRCGGAKPYEVKERTNEQ